MVENVNRNVRNITLKRNDNFFNRFGQRFISQHSRLRSRIIESDKTNNFTQNCITF